MLLIQDMLIIMWPTYGNAAYSVENFSFTPAATCTTSRCIRQTTPENTKRSFTSTLHNSLFPKTAVTDHCYLLPQEISGEVQISGYSFARILSMHPLYTCEFKTNHLHSRCSAAFELLLG